MQALAKLGADEDFSLLLRVPNAEGETLRPSGERDQYEEEKGKITMQKSIRTRPKARFRKDIWWNCCPPMIALLPLFGPLLPHPEPESFQLA